MKILFITSSSINGGAQKHIRDMFCSLTKLGNNVFLAAPDGWLLNELKQFKEKIFVVDANVKNILFLANKIEEIRPDITNTFILSGGCFGIAAWRRKQYGKIFVTVNNPVIYEGITVSGKMIYPLLYRWMSKYASAFLVKSDRIRIEVAEIIKNKEPVISIKNGIDFKIFDKGRKYADLSKDLNIPEKAIVISDVAALDERKGLSYLIEAVCDLRKKYNIYLLIAGEGTFRETLAKQIENSKADGYIHLLGARSDINRILANSDIFVLSSLHEGLPNALMEAMAMGLPCIATDVGGVRQLIDNKVNGCIVPSRSSHKIAEAIEFLIENFAEAEIYGNKAYEKMKNEYNQESVAEELQEIYRFY